MLACLLIAAPMLCSLVLKWARCPGWPAVSGVLAGLLLGPTVLGRVAPDFFQRVVVGAQSQQISLERLVRRHQADELAATRGLIDAQAMRELKQRHKAERELAERERDAARWESQRSLRVLSGALVALTMMAAAPFGIPRGGGKPDVASFLSIGAWAAAMPGALAFASVIWLLGGGEMEAAMVAAALAVGPWALAAGDREAADAAEINGARLIQAGGRVASIAALIIAGGALLQSRGVVGLTAAAPLAVLPLTWLMPNLVSARAARVAAQHVLLPALVATTLIKVDWIDDFAFWPLLVILLLSDDGRWLGAFIGAMLPGGRPALRTMRLVVGSMAAGPTQLAVTAVGVHSGMIPPRFVLPLVLGAVLIEVAAPVRRTFAHRVSQAEAEQESPGENQ